MHSAGPIKLIPSCIFTGLVFESVVILTTPVNLPFGDEDKKEMKRGVEGGDMTAKIEIKERKV